MLGRLQVERIKTYDELIDYYRKEEFAPVEEVTGSYASPKISDLTT
jgi:hypothetical protein